MVRTPGHTCAAQGFMWVRVGRACACPWGTGYTRASPEMAGLGCREQMWGGFGEGWLGKRDNQESSKLEQLLEHTKQ